MVSNRKGKEKYIIAVIGEKIVISFNSISVKLFFSMSDLSLSLQQSRMILKTRN